MIVGTLYMRLAIRASRSLKDKRRVIKSLKERLRNNFNVSISEVDSQDNRQSAVLGVSMVGTDTQYVNSVLSKLVDHVKSAPGVELVDYELEMF